MNKDSIKEYFLGSRNIIDELKKIVSRLREMSPLYEDFVKENRA